MCLYGGSREIQAVRGPGRRGAVNELSSGDESRCDAVGDFLGHNEDVLQFVHLPTVAGLFIVKIQGSAKGEDLTNLMVDFTGLQLVKQTVR